MKLSKNKKMLMSGMSALALFTFGIVATTKNTTVVHAASEVTKPATFHYSLEKEFYNKKERKDFSQTVMLKAKEGQTVTVNAPLIKGYSGNKKVYFTLWHGKFIQNSKFIVGPIYSKDNGKLSKVDRPLGSNVEGAKATIKEEPNVVLNNLNKGIMGDTYVSPNYGHFNSRTITYHINSHSKKYNRIILSAINGLKKNGTLSFRKASAKKAKLLITAKKIKGYSTWKFNYNNEKHNPKLLVKSYGTLNTKMLDKVEATNMIVRMLGLKQNNYMDSMAYSNAEAKNIKITSILSQGDKDGLARAYKNVK